MNSIHYNDSQKKAWSKLSLDFFLKGNQNQLQNVKIITLWPQIVGEQIARVTRARKISHDTLIVDVKEQAWQTELSYQTPEILKKYIKHNNTDIFKIKKIYFKYDPHFKPTTLPRYDKDSSPNNLLVFTHTTPPSISPTNQSATTSNKHFKTSIDKSIARLKKLWEVQRKSQIATPNQIATPKFDTQKDHQIDSIEPLKKTSPHLIDRERLYSTEKMNSNFLFSQDEFQPFDLY